MKRLEREYKKTGQTRKKKRPEQKQNKQKNKIQEKYQ